MEFWKYLSSLSEEKILAGLTTRTFFGVSFVSVISMRQEKTISDLPQCQNESS